MPTHQTDAFPHFANGDVLIELSTMRRYELHSSALKVASRFFKELLTEKNAAALCRRPQKNFRWRFELNQYPNEDGEVVNLLIMGVGNSAIVLDDFLLVLHQFTCMLHLMCSL